MPGTTTIVTEGAAFSGSLSGQTQSAFNNSTALATTAYVDLCDLTLPNITMALATSQSVVTGQRVILWVPSGGLTITAGTLTVTGTMVINGLTSTGGIIV